VDTTWNGHHSTAKTRSCRALLLGIAAVAAFIGTTGATENAIANGDTRSLTFLHTHTGESATITFRRDGRYDDRALEQLNWLLRDWRANEPAKMDPRLFDIVWEVYREVGSSQPIQVVSAYRSPTTNAMLRRRSKAVSEHSQHMLGKAIDIRLGDVDPGRIREAAMRLQYGGVGYYPGSFVHVDTGSVRAWPRMTQDQLARLFPDGKTVHLPPSGKPLARYEEARAEVLSRKESIGSNASGGSIGSLFAGLFRRQEPATPEPTSEPEAKAAPAAVMVASADVTAYAPLPPRRPVMAAVASIEPSLVSGTAVAVSTTASASSGNPASPQSPASALLFSPTPVAGAAASHGTGETAAGAELRPPAPRDVALYSAAQALDLGFSLQRGEDLGTARFSGPAVKPLPLIRQANAEF
jgi:uncharacterized protein YcbK (DUF882 family)